jgi:release factor glutamine methyltransferase
VDDVVARLRAAGCVFAEDEAAVLLGSAASADELAAMVERRAAGFPLEHVVGWAEFCGRRVLVGPGVFVPRRRSEFLVRCAVAVATPDAVVVDLCCGTGAVGAAVAAGVEGIELHAADADPAAVAWARVNLPDAGVHEGDLDAALPDELRGRVDLIVAVAPYVPTDAVRLMPPEARDHEPRPALDGGADGLDVVRRLADLAPSWLVAGGRLLVEVGDHQAGATAAAFTTAGLDAHRERDDEVEATVVVGRLGPDGIRATLPP